MQNIVVATRNKDKYNEIKEILKDMPFEVISMDEAGVDLTADIEETGKTFEENALIKAKKVCELTGEITIADDSGIEIDYLGGAPGIYSSRFGGKDATDFEKNKQILEMLEGVPFEKRSARFTCAIAAAYPDGNHFVVKGLCNGYIGYEPKGSNGFGYDPIFFVPEYGMTTAQMKPEEKHKISHRGNALRLMLNEFKKRNTAQNGKI